MYKLFFLVIILFTSSAQAVQTKANYAILVDADTGSVLFEKNSDIAMAPSSMSKLMTIYMVFEQLKNNKLQLTDKFYVSEKAWRKQGSKMFIHVNDYVTVNDLLLGIIVQSGNDACIAIAEGIGGSEENFAQSMNKKAKELGITNSNFTNATGWPDEKHLMSARDLSILAQKLIRDFPEYYHFFSVKEFVYNHIKQQNRNMLLDRKIGVDGLKTGHADDAGYGITASALRDNRRLILVINGLSGTVERASEAAALLQYGFLNFENVTVAKKEQTLAQIPVWMGIKEFLPVSFNKDLVLTVPKHDSHKVKVTIEYNEPLIAPVKKGDEVAHLLIETIDGKSKSYKIYSHEDIAKKSFLKRIFSNIHYNLFKKR